MTIRITNPVAVGAAIINGTSNGVLYIDASGNLAQDAAHFYWDPANNRLGIGLNLPTGPVDAIGSDGGTLYGQIKNSNSAGTAAWRGVNDSNVTFELGSGGSGRSDILQSAGYMYSSAGGASYVNAGTGAFRWAIGGVSTANVVMSLDNTAALALGLAGTITGSLKLSGSTSGTVTVKGQNTAGTWTLNLPAAAGSDGDVLTWQSGVTQWAAGGGGGMSIGGGVTSGTAGSVLFVGSGPVLSQDNSNFFWDNTNKALGIGKNSSLSAAVPLDILKSAASATVYGNVKNSDSTGAAGFRGTNDADHFVEYGMGGTGRSDALDDSGYFISSANGIKFCTVSAHGFDWLINGVSTAVIKMSLNLSGQLGVGMSPNTILSLFESNSGATTSGTVRNDSNSGASSWKALNDNNESFEVGMGGSARGDGLQSKGFLFSATGIRVFTVSSTPFDICINGIADSDRAFAVDGSKNIVIGNAALATNATDGFIYIPSCAGAPSGTPTSKTGRVPMVYDTSNDALYVYNGSWKSVTLA